MKRHPNLISAYQMCSGFFNDTETLLPSGDWVPARPEGFASLWWRFRAAWMVFTGRWDALFWAGQE